MKLCELLKRDRLCLVLKALALELMLGITLGYLLFHSVFPYFTAPLGLAVPLWLVLLMLIGIGFGVGILMPDPRSTLISAMAIPGIAMFYSFLLFISPSFSASLVTYDLTENLFFMMRYLLVYVFSAFLVIMICGFLAQYIFETLEPGSEDDVFPG